MKKLTREQQLKISEIIELFNGHINRSITEFINVIPQLLQIDEEITNQSRIDKYYLNELQKLNDKSIDRNVRHDKSVKLICQFLNDIGYNNIVEQFFKNNSWHMQDLAMKITVKFNGKDDLVIENAKKQILFLNNDETIFQDKKGFLPAFVKFEDDYTKYTLDFNTIDKIEIEK